jgi:hypothetical protein
VTSWKAFWIGVGTALGAIIGGFGLISILRRKSKPDAITTPQAIAHEAEEKIDAIHESIKADSDEALAARFDMLAKKQARKKDET